jgi:hypothetical protein
MPASKKTRGWRVVATAAGAGALLITLVAGGTCDPPGLMATRLSMVSMTPPT